MVTGSAAVTPVPTLSGCVRGAAPMIGLRGWRVARLRLLRSYGFSAAALVGPIFRISAVGWLLGRSNTGVMAAR